MAELPEDFVQALLLLARASERYRQRTGCRVVIVGGAAVSFYTQGAVLSGDFDMVADMEFEKEMLAEGFIKERRSGKLLIGYHHPRTPRLGFQLVSGYLFDGKADQSKLLPVKMTDDAQAIFPAIEDLIADRLGQYAASNDRDNEMLAQARLLFQLAGECDEPYLRRRVAEETGNVALIGL